MPTARVALISRDHSKFFEINDHFKRIFSCREIASTLQTFCERYRAFAKKVWKDLDILQIMI